MKRVRWTSMLVAWCAVAVLAAQPVLQAAAACQPDAACCCCASETPDQSVGAECRMDCGSTSEAPQPYAEVQGPARTLADEFLQPLPPALHEPLQRHASLTAWRPPVSRSDRPDLRSTILRL